MVLFKKSTKATIHYFLSESYNKFPEIIELSRAQSQEHDTELTHEIASRT